MAGLLLLGAGGHSRVVAETALASCAYDRIALLDDLFESSDDTNTKCGWPVIGTFASIYDPKLREQFPSAIVALGDASLRLKLLPNLIACGYELPSIIHPTAWVSSSANIGLGSVVFAQAAVQSQASIGCGVILNTGCSVDHDVILDDGVHICPGARLAGEVKVGARSSIGIGASVIQQVRIGSDVTVGAGSCVVRDLSDGITAVGVPARVMP